MDISNQDSIQRFLFDNHGVRGEIVKLNTPFTELLHDSYPKIIKKIMMELAVSSVLVASTLKDGSEIMVQIHGGKTSKIKYALINIRQDLSFYGSAALQDNCQIDDKDTLASVCSNDSVLVLSVFSKDGQKWQGVVQIDTTSIAKTLENYFKESQQLPTRFVIHSDVATSQAGGIMLQIIPEIKDNVESLEHLSILADTLSPQELYSLSFNDILLRLFAHEEVKVFEPKTVEFKCSCSRARCENALQQLSQQELADLAKEEQGTSMTCQHCGKTYTFTKEDLQTILAKVSQ
ncbi:MAG: Hsp33 family molecular chaperone HslO [Succinivibrio sp.]|nr:Hsp33 family molecular chaperone HslO [Succinivibrio sp.]MBQ8477926.1 Hsp33 family molecular chaperone HslO [Succinivibrio sp.]MCI5638680.1 Hsp33 family molecular chaperone HslO [Succinivibrio sp.]MCI6449082.1 Hsp33 family molecular chaperone HslO [Succinivibrio sp.]MDD6067670.1 Hsp33 family molecular chaperone HslO [Succinivibrio sp.]